MESKICFITLRLKEAERRKGKFCMNDAQGPVPQILLNVLGLLRLASVFCSLRFWKLPTTQHCVLEDGKSQKTLSTSSEVPLKANAQEKEGSKRVSHNQHVRFSLFRMLKQSTVGWAAY